MSCTRRDFLAAMAAGGTALTLAACGGTEQPGAPAATTEAAPKVDLAEFKALGLDMGAWHHDGEHDVWWQIGLDYCTKPASKTYERLAVYVPGPYLKLAGDDGSKDLSQADASATYRCELNPEGTVGSFTCETAPIVMPVNAAGFAAQPAATAYLYDGLGPYLSAGLVYVYAGCRGRSSGYDSASSRSGDGFFSGGVPWAACDLKAAVRYLRYNKASLPGNTDRIMLFGHTAGGAIACVVGTTGNSSLYDAYLKQIGAATHDAQGATVTDEVAGVACWSPEVSLGAADAAYEWGMGQFVTEGTREEGTWTRALSEDLAASYAGYVNGLGLVDGEGQALSLDETDGGVFTDGTYYEHVVGMVEGALETFLNGTAFPHTEPSQAPTVTFPGAGVLDAYDAQLESAVTAPAEDVRVGSATGATGATTPASPEQVQPQPQAPGPDVVYQTREDYVASVNGAGHWVTYNERRGTARIASLSALVQSYRRPTLNVCAFDTTARNTSANQLFGNDDNPTLHFSAMIGDLLDARREAYEASGGWDPSLPEAWSGDLAQTDALGTTIETRRNMYDPMYFLSGAEAGFGTAAVAGHWRINSGVARTDAPVTPESNLALALKRYDGVQDVTYTPVWSASAVAEQTGDATSALVSWVTSRFPTE